MKTFFTQANPVLKNPTKNDIITNVGCLNSREFNLKWEIKQINSRRFVFPKKRA